MRSPIPVFILFLIITLSPGCEECTDCGPTAEAPGTFIQFINASELAVIQGQIAEVDSELSDIQGTLTPLSFNINSYNDAKSSVEDLIAEGQTDLQDSLDLLNESLAVWEPLQLELETQQTELTATRTDLAEQQSLIGSGAVLVSTIRNVRNGWEMTNADSATEYVVPLEVNLDSTQYEFEIDGNTYDLTISYTREQTLDVERVVRIAANSLLESSIRFDSTDLFCPESNANCRSGETTIICYF